MKFLKWGLGLPCLAMTWLRLCLKNTWASLSLDWNRSNRWSSHAGRFCCIRNMPWWSTWWCVWHGWTWSKHAQHPCNLVSEVGENQLLAMIKNGFKFFQRKKLLRFIIILEELIQKVLAGFKNDYAMSGLKCLLNVLLDEVWLSLQLPRGADSYPDECMHVEWCHCCGRKRFWPGMVQCIWEAIYISHTLEWMPNAGGWKEDGDGSAIRIRWCMRICIPWLILTRTMGGVQILVDTLGRDSWRPCIYWHRVPTVMIYCRQDYNFCTWSRTTKR